MDDFDVRLHKYFCSGVRTALWLHINIPLSRVNFANHLSQKPLAFCNPEIVTKT